MRGRGHALRVGVGRGWTEFVLSLRNWSDLFTGIGTVFAVLFVLNFAYNFEFEVAGVPIPYSTLALPGLLVILIALAVVVALGYTVAYEREDGTMLRARCAPHGMTGYAGGHCLAHMMNQTLTLMLIVIPSSVFFGAFAFRGVEGWLTFAWVAWLGLLATMPIGLIIGALAPSAQKAGTWGLLPVFGLVYISGLFTPLSYLSAWMQAVAQIFPFYWLGLGLRSAFLPAQAVAYELGGSWRALETAGVLGLWAVAGLAVATLLLRRMARRQSGSAVAQAKDRAMQKA